jgi:hypothetical protein
MNPAKTAKLLALYDSGFLSAVEVANSLLYDLVREPDLDTAFLASIDSLPKTVRDAFSHRLQLVKEADFHWAPFLLGPTVPFDSPEHAARLRAIYDFLKAAVEGR